MQKVEVEKLADFSGHKDAVYTLAGAGGADAFFSAGGDGMVIRWGLHDMQGEVVARLPAAIYGLVYRQDRNLLLASTRQGHIYKLDLEARQLIQQISLQGDIFDIQCMPEHNLLIAAAGGGYLYFLDMEKLEVIQAYHPTDQNAREIVISSDRKLIATGWSDKHVRLYDPASCKEVFAFEAHDNSVFALAFSRDDKYLLSGGRDAAIKVWDHAEVFELHKSLPAHWFTVNDIQMHPAKDLFASGSRDKSVKIWDAASFELLKVIDRSKFAAHSHSVNKALWLPGTDILLSASDDKHIMAWQVSALGN